MNRVLIFLTVLSVASLVDASPKKFYLRQDKNNTSAVIEELQNHLDDIRVESSNHESEIRMFEEKLNNQELAVDSLWKQFHEANQNNRENVRGAIEQLEMKLANLEGVSTGSLSDIDNLKKTTNSSKDLVAQQKQKIGQLEKVIEVQSQNIEHLQVALQALMDALQIKDVAISTEDPYHSLSSGPIYQVKPGDSLEKIARRNHTTVAKLKEINHLTNNKDLIIVGQKLKLPE